MHTYKHGTAVELVIRFVHRDQPADPQLVQLHIKPPNRPWELLTAGESRILLCEEVGRYQVTLRTNDSDAPGIWKYKWIWQGLADQHGGEQANAFVIQPPEEEL